MLIVRKKNIVINEKISERRIKMNTETLNNFEMSSPMADSLTNTNDLSEVSSTMCSETNIADTTTPMKEGLDGLSTGEKVGIGFMIGTAAAGAGYAIYKAGKWLYGKCKAKRAAKKAAKEVKVEEDSK